MALLDTPTIIGIIVGVALFAVTVAVCIYLYSLKNKSSSELDAPEESDERGNE